MIFLNWIVENPIWGGFILLGIFLLAHDIQANFFNTIATFARRKNNSPQPPKEVK